MVLFVILSTSFVMYVQKEKEEEIELLKVHYLFCHL